jgi:hypothetical protein
VRQIILFKDGTYTERNRPGLVGHCCKWEDIIPTQLVDELGEEPSPWITPIRIKQIAIDYKSGIGVYKEE